MHRKAIAFFAGLSSVAFFLLTQFDRLAHLVSFFSFPDDVEKALIAISKVPTLLAWAILLVGVACLIYVTYDHFRGHPKKSTKGKTSKAEAEKNTVLDALQIVTGNEEPFDHVEVNDHGIHRTISVAVVNVGDGRLTNCIIRRKYISFGEPRNVPVFLDGGFTLFPGDKRYVAIATFNEHRNPHTSNLIGLCAQCVGGYFDANMIAVPRLPIGSYNLTLEATSLDSRMFEILLPSLGR